MPRAITYTLSVTLTQEIDEDAGELAYTDRQEIRHLEKGVIRALTESRHLDGTFDCECLQTEIKDVQPSIPERFRPRT